MPSLYTFTDYSPEWPAKFRLEAARLESLLGDELVTVHHIGSTSVPGLSAKPVIDLLPLVRAIVRVDDFTPQFQEAGYKAWGEYGLPGRRYFSKDHGDHRAFNVHVYQVGDPAIDCHLAFCAYLRSHDSARAEYETLKREAFARHPADIEAYMAGKDARIERVELVALAWYRTRAPA